jgi:dihydrofolate reductase
MRRIRYGVAMSLDGYIADAQGGTNWLVADPSLDPREFFAGIDTVIMGRRTYEVMCSAGMRAYPGLRTYVASRTLAADEVPEVTVLADDLFDVAAALRREPSPRDIWLAGGGTLAATMLRATLVDTIEVGISPRLLARPGVPLVAPWEGAGGGAPGSPFALELVRSRVLASGLVVLEYEVLDAAAA